MAVKQLHLDTKDEVKRWRGAEKEMNQSDSSVHLNPYAGCLRMVNRELSPNRTGKVWHRLSLTPELTYVYFLPMTVIRQSMCMCCRKVTTVSLAGETAT